MQALKLFNQGQGSGNQGQGAFLALAMSEASKVRTIPYALHRTPNTDTYGGGQLFDNKAAAGKVTDGASKESTIQKAGEMAMKMYLKSQGEQQGGLMAMASKFLK